MTRGDDEARVGFAVGPFRLGDDAALARPAVQRRPRELLEAARRLSARLRRRLGRGKLALDHRSEAGIARQAEQIIDAIGRAPGHQGLAGEARIGPQQDARGGPAGAELRHDPGDLLHRSGARIDVGFAKLRRQEMATAEHIKRQIAVAVVIAMEEAALLMAVQRVIGGVEIEDDLLGWAAMGFHKQIDQQRLDHRRIVADLVVAGRQRPAQLEPVERRLARHRRAILSPRFKLAGKNRHHRIMAELIAIDQVLIAQRQSEDALADQRLDLVLDQLLAARVTKAGGKAIIEPDRPIGRAEQQRPCIRGARLRPLQIQTNPGYTLFASGRSANPANMLNAQQVSLIRRLDAPHSLRNPG